mmetsp:Transcript_16643/g.47370  ORF Transcript_16643/g.47370 Transcript_16643/m.47370 type:complete len:226 (-) Transcript_16643:13-690(-)
MHATEADARGRRAAVLRHVCLVLRAGDAWRLRAVAVAAKIRPKPEAEPEVGPVGAEVSADGRGHAPKAGRALGHEPRDRADALAFDHEQIAGVQVHLHDLPDRPQDHDRQDAVRRVGSRGRRDGGDPRRAVRHGDKGSRRRRCHLHGIRTIHSIFQGQAGAPPQVPPHRGEGRGEAGPAAEVSVKKLDAAAVLQDSEWHCEICIAAVASAKVALVALVPLVSLVL